MFSINAFVSSFNSVFPNRDDVYPWVITNNLLKFLTEYIQKLNSEYKIKDGIAIHNTATIENQVIFKAPVVVGPECFIGAHAYLRGGVFLGTAAKVGPGCEIKTSIIFPESALAHFNFVGDSIIGRNVNFEAGAITANHYNERENKRIFALLDSQVIDTGVEKFGALVGDTCKIGANAVLSPGTILEPVSIVKRLELIEQIKI